MAVGTLDFTMKRIEDAPKYSPIAVFSSLVPGKLKSKFGATAYSQIEMKQSDNFIGLYCRHDNLKKVRQTLRNRLVEES